MCAFLIVYFLAHSLVLFAEQLDFGLIHCLVAHIFSWTSFLGIFYRAFPSPQLRQIEGFAQHDGEFFHQAWARFCGYLDGYPHHGLSDDRLRYLFFEGLLQPMQAFVQEMCGRGLL